MYFVIPAGILVHDRVRDKKAKKKKREKPRKKHQKSNIYPQYLYLPKVETNGDTDFYEEESIFKFMYDYVFGKDNHIIVLPEDHFVEMHYHKGSIRYEGEVNENNLYHSLLALYPSKPTVDFELLRFGRVIGDADFPFWKGWGIANDDRGMGTGVMIHGS